jgi:NAD(P)-dependent dehydrogenase (short-subunit alcohol dehydrogenase family)
VLATNERNFDMTVWFITGASRGFGLEITREALSRGDSVIATARNPQAVLDAHFLTAATGCSPSDSTSARQNR